MSEAAHTRRSNSAATHSPRKEFLLSEDFSNMSRCSAGSAGSAAASRASRALLALAANDVYFAFIRQSCSHSQSS